MLLCFDLNSFALRYAAVCHRSIILCCNRLVNSDLRSTDYIFSMRRDVAWSKKLQILENYRALSKYEISLKSSIFVRRERSDRKGDATTRKWKMGCENGFSFRIFVALLVHYYCKSRRFSNFSRSTVGYYPLCT